MAAIRFLRGEEMPETIEQAPVTCERCDGESRHVVKSIGTDNRPHYVCWTCAYRADKRINLKETWKRGGRAARKGKTG